MTEMCKIPPFIFDLTQNETGSACLRSSFNSKRPNLSSEALRDERFKAGNINAFYSIAESNSPSKMKMTSFFHNDATYAGELELPCSHNA